MGLFRKAGEKFVGGKFYCFGEEGSGKSRFITSFPKIGAIDTETGFTEYESHDNVLFVANTTSFKEVEEAMIEIMDEYLDDIETFAIDSETNIHNAMNVATMKVAEKKAIKDGKDPDDANTQIRGFGKIKNVTRKLQLMKIDISSRGKYIVSTAQKSDINKMIGDKMVKVGEKAEAHKSLPYDYDVVLRFFVEKTKVKGKEQAVYKAEVLKDRTGVKQKYDIIENPSFDIWKKHYETKRENGTIEPTHYMDAEEHDTESLEQEQTAIDDAKALIKKVVAIDKSHIVPIFKELKISKVAQIDDMDKANKVIEYCNNKLKELEETE